MKTQKRLAASILKTGIGRIRVDSKDEEAKMAMTHADVKKAIVRGSIYALPKIGTSRFRAKLRAIAKKKGRHSGQGKRKGPKGARTPKKRLWITRIRAIRKKLHELKASGQITPHEYRRLYRASKSGIFKSKAHVESASKGGK